MKITPLQYAKALLELTDGKSEQEISVVVGKFAENLKKEGNLGIALKVIGKFSQLWNEKKGIVEVEVTSREKMDDALVSKVKEFVKKRYAAKDVEIVNLLDSEVKGGIVIRVGDEIIDGSIAGQLKELKKHLIS